MVVPPPASRKTEKKSHPVDRIGYRHTALRDGNTLSLAFRTLKEGRISTVGSAQSNDRGLSVSTEGLTRIYMS